MTTLRFIDQCTAGSEVKPEEVTITREPGVLSIDNDSIFLDDSFVAHRVEPHGLGDVHWEVEGDPYRRFTRIEVS